MKYAQFIPALVLGCALVVGAVKFLAWSEGVGF